ncbi:MAG: NAD-dependent epimerase/dehydratase family protein [Bacillota bacterium]|nr:NAD-dependent epimerase/dehydratase family protein [Bacillota bacterium]
MKALVMGGTEFVSSSMAKYLISMGYVVDIFTRGMKPVNYSGVRRHLKGDRKSIESLKENLSGEAYDYVFDISAYTKEDVEEFTEVLNKDNLKRYVFCSSGSVYKPTKEIASEEFERGENENWGDYGLDKKKAEDYLLNLYEKSKFPVTIFRPTYIYGEGNNLYREGFFFDRISSGEDIAIPEGDAANQFVYISDIVKCFEGAVHNDKAIGQAYNITHPEIVSWEYLAQAAMEAVGTGVNVKRIKETKYNITTREYFPFRNVTYLLDVKKLKEDGLCAPEISLCDGLRKAYEWYSKAKPRLKDARMDKVDFVLTLAD